MLPRDGTGWDVENRAISFSYFLSFILCLADWSVTAFSILFLNYARAGKVHRNRALGLVAWGRRSSGEGWRGIVDKI